MITEHVLYSALHQDPDDDLTWAALADWLEETGQGTRAELLRCSRQVRGLPAAHAAEFVMRERILLDSGVRPVVPHWTNPIGMRFALVEPGTFLMGPAHGEGGHSAATAMRHEVQIPAAFWIGIHPVTQEQWTRVMGSNPSHFSRTGAGRFQVQGISDAELEMFPVESISYEDASTFLAALNSLSHSSDRTQVYRLPTAAQWEFACRGGPVWRNHTDRRSLPFHLAQPTTSLCSEQANFDGNFPYAGAAAGPYFARPCKVGSYQPNALGIYDMHGNVWEWCMDRYGEYQRVRRGGGWGSVGRVCRAAHCDYYPPNNRSPMQGMRVVFGPPSLNSSDRRNRANS